MMNKIKTLPLVLLYFQLVFGCYATQMQHAQHPDDTRIRGLRYAFFSYAKINGKYPKGQNWQIVKEMQHPKTGICFVPTKIDAKGNLLDVNDNPYVFFFSKEGWVLIASLSKDKTAIERSALLPPVGAGKPDGVRP